MSNCTWKEMYWGNIVNNIQKIFLHSHNQSGKQAPFSEKKNILDLAIMMKMLKLSCTNNWTLYYLLNWSFRCLLWISFIKIDWSFLFSYKFRRVYRNLFSWKNFVVMIWNRSKCWFINYNVTISVQSTSIDNFCHIYM